MNNRYFYKNGKIKVIDDKNRKHSREYQDNIEEVLITENIIEALIERKMDLIEKIGLIKLDNGTTMINQKFNRDISLALSLLVTIILSMAGSLALGVVPMVLWVAIFSIYELHCKKQRTIIHKKLNGCNLELKKIEEELLVNKNLLSQLSKYMTINNKDQIEKCPEIRKIDDKAKLKYLKKCLETYNKIGVNETEYLRYYSEGTLDDKLGDVLDKEQVQLVKTYFNNRKKYK